MAGTFVLRQVRKQDAGCDDARCGGYGTALVVLIVEAKKTRSVDYTTVV